MHHDNRSIEIFSLCNLPSRVIYSIKIIDLNPNKMFQKASLAIKIIKVCFKAGKEILQLKNTASTKAIQKPIGRPKLNSIVSNIKGSITWTRKFVKGTNESERKKEEIQGLINAVAKISYPIIPSQTEEVFLAISQLSEIVKSDDLLRLLPNESLENLFIGISKFYEGRYAYALAVHSLGDGLISDTQSFR
jgi:hypothetical protein